jgi:uncharacterized protein (DUF697 family)
MHDIDRTQLELSPESEYFEYEQYEGAGEYTEVLSESEVMGLASELLAVTNEQELDQFLGNLIRRAGSAIGRVVRSPIGQAVGGVLKGVVRKALPLAGGALGGFVGGPLGARLGSSLASAAGGALGLESEALSQEDREFEGAQQFVRLAADTVQKATAAAPSADPRAVAQSAVTQAAQALAPGLLQAAARPAAAAAGYGSGGRSGRWMRRGNRIVLFGV